MSAGHGVAEGDVVAVSSSSAAMHTQMYLKNLKKGCRQGEGEAARAIQTDKEKI